MRNARHLVAATLLAVATATTACTENTTKGAAVGAAEADAHCLASPLLADYKRPRAYAFVDELPRTATGKKMHYRLRADAVRADAAGELEHLAHRPRP